MAQATLRRGQVERLLWGVLSPTGGIVPHREFSARFKRLVDFDRYGGPNFEPVSPPVFTDTSGPRGSGTDAQHTEKNVLLLGLSLQLIDSGFSVLEAVYMMQHLGGQLGKSLLDIVKRGIPYSRLDSLGNIKTVGKLLNGKPDPRVFMLVDKHEFREYFAAGKKEPDKNPRISPPRLIAGAQALAADLDEELGYHKKRVLIIELWSLVMRIHTALADPPDVRRGRSK